MDGKLEISLDKLPVKRLEAIEENGAERFPPDVDYDEKRVSLIRRIDFAWAVEKDDNKKQKKSSKESGSSSAATPWPWQGMVENLQLAHQELSVIIDLIKTVEANDAVTVAGMTRPKPLPNEILSDLAVSAATKLQCYRVFFFPFILSYHNFIVNIIVFMFSCIIGISYVASAQSLGKYFKQSAKSLEQQISREARFYGALIRLQQNWKVKRQRVAASVSGNEGFTIDLFDSSLYDSTVVLRPSSLSTIRVDHDSAGMLAINLPPNSCHSLHFGFLGVHSGGSSEESSKVKTYCSANLSREANKDSVNDDECVRKTHSLLREVHQSIFNEQVFDIVNREAFNQSLGVNVTGIQENYLQLGIGQGISVVISLIPSSQGDQTVDNSSVQNGESAVLPLDSFYGVKLAGEKDDILKKRHAYPNHVCYEIYLQQIFHEHLYVRAKNRSNSVDTRVSGQPTKNWSGILGHFCMSLAHRIFSNKVRLELENVVRGIPYLQLVSHPTWHSRTSSWTLFLKVPQSILQSGSQTQGSEIHGVKNAGKSQFRTKVVVNDDRINVEGEGTPNVVGLFKCRSEDMSSMNKYDCDLADLSVIILQQVASQVIRWLHEEALMVGIKANRDFLCLSFELEQGETVSLVAHVDPEDIQGCISWWLVMEDGFVEEMKLRADVSEGASDYKKFLGYLSLDVLYSALMDLVSLCGGGSH